MDGTPVDLSAVLKKFNAWDQHVVNVLHENQLLEHKIELTKKEIEAAKERENYLLKELKGARDMVTVLQSTLSKRCDLEDENARLRKEHKADQKEMDTKLKEIRDEMTGLELAMEDLKKEHTDHVENVKSELQQTASEEKEKLQQVVDEKSQHIAQLDRQLRDLEHEKQSELMKLRLEYDSKLLMLQKQNTKAQQNTSQMSAPNQDIFRKKLQHVRAESEREISSLKRTISELESRLESQGPRPVNQPSGLSLAKRRRF